MFEDNTQITAFFNFMRERELIRLRKESGQPMPWTKDKVLQEYKFTNVRREHDWTSRRLIEEFYDDHFVEDPKEILMNAALFRYFGTFEFAEAIGWQSYEDFDFEEIKRLAAERLSRKMRVFTGAYVITNQGISAPKQEVVVDYFLKALHKAAPILIEVLNQTQKWESVATEMRKINGFGGSGFMTKEILLDTTYTRFWSDRLVPQESGSCFSYPNDWKVWTPIGPGARRGIARIKGVEDPKVGPIPKEDICLSAILYLVECQHISDNWPKEYGYLSPTDIQFQLCEFDKYRRVILGQGRPRSKYRPR